MPSEIVWLSNFNFADVRPRSNSNPARLAHDTTKLPTTPISPRSNAHGLFDSQPQGPANVFSYSSNINNPNAHVRMAEDTFGEELAPDATIWKLYVEEAIAQDQELVNAQNKNLDVMLLFAALFSAILTTFLVDAKNMLTVDHAEVSTGLLLQIAQSQQRVELGNQITNSTLIELPAFQPTLAARWINGLWFTALALSLAAALVAMLAKEWLSDFVATTVRPPYEYALLRQARHNGLIAWRALPIIALLPTLLHLSLLLFSLGIILLLWGLDQAIAMLVIAVVGSTAIFYVVTAILGAIFESCPFVTYISKYVRRVWSTCLGNRYILRNNLSSKKLLHHDGIPDKVLQALGWLAANSRDKAVADCAYQALAACAGTNEAPIRVENGSSSTVITQTESCLAPQKPMSGSEKTTNITFLEAVCQKFSEALVQNHREVAACQGANIARYAAAIPNLVEHVKTFTGDGVMMGIGQVAVAKYSRDLDFAQARYDAVGLAVRTLDMAWGNDCPALSADSYAILSSAELRLAAAVAMLEVPSTYGLTQFTAPHGQPETTAIRISFSDSAPLPTNTSPARYGRALARASVLLHYHACGQINMNPAVLIYLLNSISSAADCERLSFDLVSEFRMNVVGGSMERCSTMNDLDHPTGIFRRVLAVWQSEQIPGAWTRLDLATAQAVASFARAFVGRWTGRKEIHGAQTRARSSSYRGIDFELPIASQVEEDRVSFLKILESGVGNRRHGNIPESPEWILGRLLLISIITLTQSNPKANNDETSDLVLWTLYRAAEAFSIHKARHMHHAVTRHANLIRRMVEVVDNRLREESLSSSIGLPVITHIVSMLSLSIERRTVMFYSGLSPSKLLAFLRIIVRAPAIPNEVERLLSELVQMIQDRPKGYLRVFSESDGFTLLVSIGRHPEYIAAVASAIRSITQLLGSAREGVALSPGSMLGFLEAISFVLSYSIPDDELSSTGAFAESVFSILYLSSKKDSSNFPRQHTVFPQLLTYFENIPLEKMSIALIKLRKLIGWDYAALGDLDKSLVRLFRARD